MAPESVTLNRAGLAREGFSARKIRSLAEFSARHPNISKAAKYFTPIITAGAAALGYHELTAAPISEMLAATAAGGGVGGYLISHGVALRVKFLNSITQFDGLANEKDVLSAQVTSLHERLDATRSEILALQAHQPDFVTTKRASIELLKREKLEIELRLTANNGQISSTTSGHGEKVRLRLAQRSIQLDLDKINARISEEEAELVTLTPLTRLKSLGEGGMGAVYQYYSEGLGKNVVVKRIRTDSEMEGARSALLKRLEVEALNLAAISHNNVGRLYAFMDVDGEPSIIQEFIDGKALDAMIIRDPKKSSPKGNVTAIWCDQLADRFADEFGNKKQDILGLDFIVKIALQISEGLKAAHDKKIVHRDLKPSNILVAEEDGKPVAKIIDFGISKDTTEQKGSGLTVARTVMGTPAYMSPEQMEDLSKVGAPTDVYALGIMLFEMITGDVPFADEASHRPNDVARQYFYHEMKTTWKDPEISGLPKKHPLQALFAQMVAINQNDRPDIDEVISRLKKMVG